MRVDDFDFDLPEASIALRPAHPRDTARLLEICPDGEFSNHRVFDIPSLLRSGDVLVLNETRVLPAALRGMRTARAQGGGGDVAVDINLHKHVSPFEWKAFARPAKRLRQGDVIWFLKDFQAEVLDDPEGGDVRLKFNLSEDEFIEALEECGLPPLPPYIGRKREVDERDQTDYQTVFAKHNGSVAAPTAGLHFTPSILKRLEDMVVETERLTLHVGAGTFLPVKTENIKNHIMHSEWFSISDITARRLNQARKEGRRIIAVGTTALRALESASQSGMIDAVSGETNIFITPGYEFRCVDGLITNFHLPRSTLFMLVSAFCGLDVMKRAYQYAIDEGYRFYSYGDTSLLWRSGGTFSF